MNADLKHIDSLVELNKNGRLAIFVGAGIAKSTDTESFSMPSWADIINTLKADLGDSDSDDYLKIAQLYYLEFGEYAYYKKIKSFFPGYIEPSIIYKQIFDLNPQYIITTNWDNIFEDTIKNNAYIYDVISSDRDLVMSSYNRKVIKMHGDFKNDNIVFKEDDYLNYALNFPLIENYIKSILSTNAVLFLGYSYSDFNLKQITKWIQFHSNVKPPMYLITLEDNNSQRKYLENYGIYSISIYNEIYKKNKEKYRTLPEKSQGVAAFLGHLISIQSFPQLLGENDFIKYFSKKLEPLNSLRGLLYEQILDNFPGSKINFDENSRAILELPTTLESDDLIENYLELYKQLFRSLGEFKVNEKLRSIFSILRKADLDGVSEGEDGKVYYFSDFEIYENSTLERYYNFDYSLEDAYTDSRDYALEEAFLKYLNGDIVDSFKLVEQYINEALRKKDYPLLFILMFNRNALSSLSYTLEDKYREIFKKYERYDLQKKYNELQVNVQESLKSIFSFLNLDYFYKNIYTYSIELKGEVHTKNDLEKGALVFRSIPTESFLRQKNIFNFVLSNGLYIIRNSAYRALSELFVSIAITRHGINKIISLRRVELYSCITCTTNLKDLNYLFKSFVDWKNKDRQELSVSSEDQDWLSLKVLDNLANLYINSGSNNNVYESQLNNLIFILSLLRLRKEDVSHIFKNFIRIIDEGRNKLIIYKSINDFIIKQDKFYDTKFEKKFILDVIDVQIRKMVYGKMNGFDYRAIENNELYYLYDYGESINVDYGDERLVGLLLSGLSDSAVSVQVSISESFLVNLYFVSKNEIRDKIKTFIANVDISDYNYRPEYLSFLLMRIIRQFIDYDDSVRDKIIHFLDDLQKRKVFSTRMYYLRDQVEYIVNEQQIIRLSDILERLNMEIDSYESRRFKSI
ncbi:SIR2 family protein [Leptospira licerasiae]|uniref:SIR2 family protein n=1 Tax=Leptospira licerasiae TaxID=447106 RepID=UPI00301AD21B